MKMNPIFTRKLKGLWTAWIASGVLTQAGAALEGNYSGYYSQVMPAEPAEEACHYDTEKHR